MRRRRVRDNGQEAKRKFWAVLIFPLLTYSFCSFFSLTLTKVMQRLHLGDAPASITSISQTQRREINVQTRSHSTFFQNSTISSKAKQSISFIGPLIWNKIPVEVKKYSLVDADGNILSTEFVPLKRFKLNNKTYALSNVDYF